MPPRAAHYPEQQAHSRIPMSVPDWRQPQGLRGRPGFKPTCRAEFAAWTASGRAGLGSGGRRQGLAGLRDDAPSERSATKRRRCGGHRGACAAWPRCRWAAAGPGLDPRRRTEPHVSDHAPLVWRAPEGPEGQGGLRGAAPNEVRSPSLAGGRALRRPEHPWGHKQPDPASGRAAAHGHRHTKQPDPAGARQRLRLARNLARNALAARLAQGQAAVAVDGRTHVDEARARQERRVGAGAELADGV